MAPRDGARKRGGRKIYAHHGKEGSKGPVCVCARVYGASKRVYNRTIRAA